MLSFIKPQLIINDYKFIREIGRGQFSIVWEALHILTNHLVAIKCFFNNGDSDSPKQILEEININQKIYHPFICQYIDYFIYNANYFLVFEECVENLITFSNKRGYLDEKSAHKIFVELVYAIESLHLNYHLIHRDLKVDNILIDSNSNIRISDFGLAISMDKISSPNTVLNQVGSIYYMAPEMLANDAYDQSIDIWSLGIILYSITNGKLPFDGNNIDEIKERICHTQPQFQSHIKSFKLKSLIMRMLDKNKRSRITLKEIKSHSWFTEYKYLPFEFYVKNEFDLKKIPVNISLIQNLFELDSNILKQKIEYEMINSSLQNHQRSQEFVCYLIKMREELILALRIQAKDIISQSESSKFISSSKSPSLSQTLRTSVKNPIIPIKNSSKKTRLSKDFSKTTRINKK